jgi:HEAT repeat protein
VVSESEQEVPEWRQDPRSDVELIQAALAEEDEDAYWRLIRVLHHRPTKEVFEAARGLCDGESPQERSLGADILAQLGVSERPFVAESVDILLDLLSREEDTDVLNSVAVALGHLRDPRAIEPLVRLKDHPCEDVRDGVVFGLLTHEDPLAIKTLIELSTDEDFDVRNWATFGIGQQIDTDTPEIRDALVARLSEENGEIRGEALLGLARRKDERVIEPLIRELEAIPTAEEWWDNAIEAAEELADPRLYPYLLPVRELLSRNDSPYGVEAAIAACRPSDSGA